MAPLCRRRRFPAHVNRLWLPSQNGAFFVCLQPHHATVLASRVSALTGAKPVPLCEPSQNGWLFDRPQAHHQYSPGSTFSTNGPL
jgi:hypothetical protein